METARVAVDNEVDEITNRRYDPTSLLTDKIHEVNCCLLNQIVVFLRSFILGWLWKKNSRFTKIHTITKYYSNGYVDVKILYERILSSRTNGTGWCRH